MSDPTGTPQGAHLPSQPVAPLPTRYAASEGQGRGERAIVFEQGGNEIVLGGELFKTNSIAIQVSREAMEDARVTQQVVEQMFDRRLRPWLFPDRARWPEFVPLPRLAAFMESARVRRQRIRDAWSVLQGRERIYDPDSDDEW